MSLAREGKISMPDLRQILAAIGPLDSEALHIADPHILWDDQYSEESTPEFAER